VLHLRAEDAAQSGARFPMELVTFAQALAFPRGAVRVIGDRLADVGTRNLIGSNCCANAAQPAAITSNASTYVELELMLSSRRTTAE